MGLSILYREGFSDQKELDSCKKYFSTYHLRTEIPAKSLVIGRYSVLPYYLELEKDLQNIGSQLINTYQMHRWIADFKYYEKLKEFTPETWWLQELSQLDYNGPFVVKGVTNSKKQHWNKLMYAPDKTAAIKISSELLKDSLIGSQEIIFRKYYLLKTFEEGINGLPFSNEWRLFFYKDQLLSYGYYWSIAENLLEPEKLPQEALKTAQKIANIAANYVNFFVLDIAETLDGNWILIELNDGQMAGLSENDPEKLYKKLSEIIIH